MTWDSFSHAVALLAFLAVLCIVPPARQRVGDLGVTTNPRRVVLAATVLGLVIMGLAIFLSGGLLP